MIPCEPLHTLTPLPFASGDIAWRVEGIPEPAHAQAVTTQLPVQALRVPFCICRVGLMLVRAASALGPAGHRPDAKLGHCPSSGCGCSPAPSAVARLQNSGEVPKRIVLRRCESSSRCPGRGEDLLIDILQPAGLRLNIKGFPNPLDTARTI